MEWKSSASKTLSWSVVQLGCFLTFGVTTVVASIAKGQVFTVRNGRLPVTPLASVTFASLTSTAIPPGRGSRVRCLVWCKRVVDCRSVNIYLDTVSNSVTCEALTVYLHQITTGTTAAANWVFIQEDPVWKNASMALAFRATAGNGLSVFDTWYQSGHHDNPLDMRDCIHPSSPDPCVTHFRSYILDTWININKVLVQLYKNGTVVKEITFDGRGSSVTSWMSMDRLLMSSWTDLTPTSSANYFSIAGIDYVYRRFYLSKYFNGCPGDAGWLMVADVHPGTSVSGQCSYENGPAKPVLFFTTTSTAGVWQSLAKDTAHFMMVYVSFL